MSDLEDLAENYDQINAAGEPWDSIVGRMEAVGDHRLAAYLRERAAGGSAEAVAEPPQERTGGQRAVTVQESAEAQTADAAAGGDK